MTYLRRFLLLLVTLIVTACSAQSGVTNDPPADLCSLLPVPELSKALGQNFDSPQKSVAPRPAPDAVPGTDCVYQTRDAAASKVSFRVYVDPSTSFATLMFLRMSKFYETTTAVQGLGDEAYFDTAHGLHVRKGKVRFNISLSPVGEFTPPREKQMKELATRVVAKL